tara:strand:- start:643 stop:1959 length:1317 start_codon:yes stop_codon:yes gene_type:complete
MLLLWVHLSAAASLDWRVTKGVGSRGYGAIRVSVVTNETGPPQLPWPFPYSSSFQYRWVDLQLHSTLLENVAPSEGVTIHAGDETLHVKLPRATDGIRAIIFGDPCTSNAFKFPHKHPTACWPGVQSKTATHLPALLNLAASSIDAWGILGDNFYDRNGSITAPFFSLLSAELKSKFFFTVVGNHDYWVYGVQSSQTALDSFGNGFMQYFALDTLASLHPAPPSGVASGEPASIQDLAHNFFDFRGNPDHIQADGNHTLPVASNFFYYYQLGNVGLIGFSGAATLAETTPQLMEACASFAATPMSTRPRAIYLLGHWTRSGASSCSAGMGTPDVYKIVVTLPGCENGNVRFMMGHEHCNRIWDESVVPFLEDPDAYQNLRRGGSVEEEEEEEGGEGEDAPRGFLIGGSGAGWSPEVTSCNKNRIHTLTYLLTYSLTYY